MVYNDIKFILPHFCFSGKYVDGIELTSGNINNTYLITFEDKGERRYYTLQHINKFVFKKPYEVMSNIEKVTGHIAAAYEKAGIDPKRHVLQLVPTRDGGYLYQDDEGHFWRAYDYITGASAYDAPCKDEHIFETGRAFGEFQKHLTDFPADELYATIPDFHNTTKRFYTFVASVAADRAGRVRHIENEIEFMFEHRKLMNKIVTMLDNGKLPLRVTHNDTKINNILIDNETDKATCVIDLDTVMPGSSLYDYGDVIRFCASFFAEVEPDTKKIKLDMHAFRLFTEGFLSETNGFLDKEEIRQLPLGVLVITCELAMRFLTDYIDGDVYFKVRSPEHNLVRARAQMALLTDMEAKYDEMCAIIEEFIS